jgi:hypothetical protein
MQDFFFHWDVISYKVCKDFEWNKFTKMLQNTLFIEDEFQKSNHLRYFEIIAYQRNMFRRLLIISGIQMIKRFSWNKFL